MNSRLTLRRLSALCLLALLSHCLTLSAIGQDDADVIKVSDSPARTWTSPDGKFKREGTLVEIMGDRVKLEVKDGKSTVAQAAKLSKADQDFIESERKRISENGDSPFMDEDDGSSGTASGASPFSSGKEIDVSINYSTIPVIDLDSEETANISPENWGTTPKKSVKRFRLPAYTIHTDVTGFACSQGEKMFAVSFHEPFGVDPKGNNSPASRRNRREDGKEGIKAWVDIVDLETTKTKARWPLAEEYDAVGDVSDDGSAIATYGGTFSQDSKLKIFTVTNTGLQLEKSWSTKDENAFGARIQAVGFLPQQRLMIDYSDFLLVFQLNPVEPLFKIAKDSADWEISRDRTQAVVEKGKKRFLVDLNKGECIGVVGGPEGNSPNVSPDGSRVAKFENSTLKLRNTSGEQLDEFYCPVFWPDSELRWVDDRTISLQSPNQQFFVDVDRRVVFLEIVNAFAQRASRGGWSVDEISEAGAYLVQVSQVSAKKSTGPNIAEYQQDLPADADSLLLLKPGDSVRITTQLTADPSQEATARQKIEELMQKRGVTIDPNAANELRLTSSVRNEQVQYRSIGAPIWARGGTETVNVKMVDQAAELIVDGEMVWRTGSTSGPGFMLQMRDGETAQQAADRQSGNANGFWNSISMPKQIAKHPNGGSWNRIMQTGDGYQKLN
jgi:hypothetical protein